MKRDRASVFAQGTPGVRALAALTLILASQNAAAQFTKADDSSFHTSPLDASGISAKRAQLINFIWGNAGFPNTKQPSLHQSVPSPVANLANLQSVEALRVSMDAGEYTLAYHFVPANGKRNRLVIVHEGHTCYLDDGPSSGHRDGGIQRTIKALLADGYGVLVLSMPRFSPPNGNLGDPGNCNAGSHNSMFNLSVTGSPLKFFVEPVAVSINYLSQQSAIRYRDFNMIGLSGGGWATTLYAAIDTRVTLSFPVAGTVPLYLRVEPYSHDLEQFLPAYYGSLNPPVGGIAGYLDLYLLGSRGSGRNQIQILNRHGSCCFGEAQHNASVLHIGFEPALRTYESRLKSVAAGVPGFFRTVIDEVSLTDMISDSAIKNVILPVLGNSAQAKTISTTIRSTWSGNLCMDVPDLGRPPRNSDYIQVFQCTPGINQQFNLLSDGTIRSQWGGLCFDVPDFGRLPQNGDPMQIFLCHGGINQQFDLRSDGSLRSRKGGLCLDVPNFGRPPQNGDRLQVFQCTGGVNQSFSANKLTTTLSSVWGPSLCVDAPDFGRPPQNNDYLQIYQCHGGPNQRFNLQTDGTIRTESGALCFDVPDFDRPPKNGVKMQIFQCTGGVNQQFDVRADGTLRSRATGGLCLDVPVVGRPPRNGDRLQVFQCHGGINQKFNVNR